MVHPPLIRRQRPNHALVTTLSADTSAAFLTLLSEVTRHKALTQQHLDACAPLEVQASALRCGALEILHTLHGPVFVRGMTEVPGFAAPSRITTPDAALNLLYLRAMAQTLEGEGYETHVLTGSSVHAWNEDEHLLAVGTFEGLRTNAVNKRLKMSLRWLIDHQADLLICHPEGARRVGALAKRRGFKVLHVARPPVQTSPHETLSNG